MVSMPRRSLAALEKTRGFEMTSFEWLLRFPKSVEIRVNPWQKDQLSDRVQRLIEILENVFDIFDAH